MVQAGSKCLVIHSFVRSSVCSFVCPSINFRVIGNVLLLLHPRSSESRSKVAGYQRNVIFLSRLLKTNLRQFWGQASVPHAMLPPELWTPAGMGTLLS